MARKPGSQHCARPSLIRLLGATQSGHREVACVESAAVDDPACVQLRQRRGETLRDFRSVLREPPTTCAAGVHDRFDAAHGACCERVRASFRKLRNVRGFILRPRTSGHEPARPASLLPCVGGRILRMTADCPLSCPLRSQLSADWLRLAHEHLDYKLDRLRRHPAPGKPRCCFNHEAGYPMNWPELKGEILDPLQLKYVAHVAHGLPQIAQANYRARTEDLA